MAGRTGNARIHRDTSKSLKNFVKTEFNILNKLHRNFWKNMKSWLRSRNGTDGGIGVQMRTIRALFNMAINRGLN